MSKITLTPELFPDKPVLWMDDVGPVVLVGDFVFCCEVESEQDPEEICVLIYDKPDILPDNDSDQTIPKMCEVAKRNFQDENSTIHIKNFIMKFVNDEEYRQGFMVVP